MRYHEIGHPGQTPLKISEIGMGCWTMGGPAYNALNGQAIGWADVDEAQIEAGLRVAIEAGVNHFDNADIYGYGRAERMLSDCLDRLGVKRPEVVIASKVGHHRGTARHAYEPHHIRHQCEQSLRNLRTDYIDIYYLHHDGWAAEYEPGNLEDAAETVHRLREEGKVRVIGQSAYTDAGFERSAEVLRPAVFQSWAALTTDNFIRPGSRTQAVMAANGIKFIGFAPFNKGLLLDKFDPSRPPAFEPGDVREGKEDFSAATLGRVRAALAGLKPRFGAQTADLASLCCRFVCAHPNVAGVIPGFRSASQAAVNVRGGSDAPLSAQEVEMCRAAFRDLQLRG